MNDSALCTEETNYDDIVALLSHSDDEGDESSDDTAEQNTAATCSIQTFSSAISHIQQLISFAAEHGNTENLEYLHKIRANLEKDAVLKKECQTKINDYFK